MLRKPILIVPGQLNSIFFEIFFKSLKKKIFYSTFIFVCCFKNFKSNAKKYKFEGTYNLLSKDVNKLKIATGAINIIDIKFKKSVYKYNQLKFHNDYIFECFETAFKILENKITNKFLNGPINKTSFLNKKFLGVTEYISKRFKKKNTGMLIYNHKLSVSPVTTHLPVKLIAKKITSKLIINKLVLINDFYIKKFKFKPRIAVTGLNPHCESILNNNEDKKIVEPSIRMSQKKGIQAFGPYSADTIFLKQNRDKFNVIVGMYHDQVLTPLKTLYEYDAINITMGLPFLRVSPDHGPNETMVNKNLSNPISLIKALEFLDKN